HKEQVATVASQTQKTHTTRRAKRGRDTEIPQSSGPPKKVGDKAVYTGEDDRVVRAATTTASLETEQESVNTSGSGEDSMEHQDDLTDFVPPTPHDSSLSGGHTSRSDEESQKIRKKQRERTPKMKLFKIGTSKKKTLDKENVSKQGRDKSNKIEELNLSDKESGKTKVVDYTTVAKKDVNAAELVSTAGDAVNAASVIPDVSVVSPSTSTAGDIFEDEMTTIADTLMAIRSIRPRTTLVVIHNVEEEPRRATPLPTVQIQDKEIAQRLFEEDQAQFEKEQRIAREKAAEQEAKDAAIIEQMKDVQARMDADVLLAERLQEEEREQFTINEQARILVDLITKRKREQKWINDFVPIDSEEVNDNEHQAVSSKKRSRADHDKESVKKQKLEEDDAEK
nr:hypothetical protein [Tanacetum cinerariifolium]